MVKTEIKILQWFYYVSLSQNSFQLPLCGNVTDWAVGSKVAFWRTFSQVFCKNPMASVDSEKAKSHQSQCLPSAPAALEVQE